MKHLISGDSLFDKNKTKSTTPCKPSVDLLSSGNQKEKEKRKRKGRRRRKRRMRRRENKKVKAVLKLRSYSCLMTPEDSGKTAVLS